MGREASCHAELGDLAGQVHAWLESDAVILRGGIVGRFRLDGLKDMRVDGDVFKATTERGPMCLHLGAAEAAKWLDRIRHPRSLGQKLGLEPGVPVHLAGTHPEVLAMLHALGADMAPLDRARLIFVAVEAQDDLQALDALASSLPDSVHLWVLRLKGKAATVKESEIMARLRTHGLAPSKTAAWSDRFAADRYGWARPRP